MHRRLSRLWRQARTALAFALFGLGGALLALVVLPAARSLRGDRPGFDLRAQRWIQAGYRLFMAYMEGSRLTRVRRVGTERLSGEEPLLVVANHPMLIDTPLLGATLPQADCIVKSDWADNRFLGPAIAAANYIRRDTGNAVIDETARRLALGRSILVFPEGTRTPQGETLGRFHRGAAHIALRSGVDLLPVVITCEPRTLMKGQKWHAVPERTFQVTVRTLTPLSPKAHLDGDESASLAARKVTAALHQVFLDALSEAQGQEPA